MVMIMLMLILLHVMVLVIESVVLTQSNFARATYLLRVLYLAQQVPEMGSKVIAFAHIIRKGERAKKYFVFKYASL